jgi:hypothetical protein
VCTTPQWTGHGGAYWCIHTSINHRKKRKKEKKRKKKKKKMKKNEKKKKKEIKERKREIWIQH